MGPWEVEMGKMFSGAGQKACLERAAVVLSWQMVLIGMYKEGRKSNQEQQHHDG